MIQILAKDMTYRILHSIGFILLVLYLIISRDFSFSFEWIIGYFLLALAAAVLVSGLELHKKFPKLDRYILFTANKTIGEVPLSENQLEIVRAKYYLSGLEYKNFLLTPSEDGLICVPVILFGISPLTSVAGGLVFGLIHLGKYSYLECISKAIIYSLVCFIVLPHGILTVAAGHFSIDVFGLAVMQYYMPKWIANEDRRKETELP